MFTTFAQGTGDHRRCIRKSGKAMLWHHTAFLRTMGKPLGHKFRGTQRDVPIVVINMWSNAFHIY